jgi:hypothetical protein
MFYFTKIIIDDSPLLDAENAIRKYSLKRHVILDFKSSASKITEDKYFLGNENKNDLKITRIRTSFEWLFPKLIISVPKQTPFESFKVRYCLLSSFIFVYLLFENFQSLLNSIRDNEIDQNLFFWLIFLGLFITMTYVELRLTKRKINKAITNFDAPNPLRQASL